MTPEEIFEMGERIIQNAAVILIDNIDELPLVFEWDELGGNYEIPESDENLFLVDKEYTNWLNGLIQKSYNLKNN
jgi:hypothetical protein